MATPPTLINKVIPTSRNRDPENYVVWRMQSNPKEPALYKVVQIWPGRFVCKHVTVCPGHIWTTLYVSILCVWRTPDPWRPEGREVCGALPTALMVPYIQTHLYLLLFHIKVWHVPFFRSFYGFENLSCFAIWLWFRDPDGCWTAYYTFIYITVCVSQQQLSYGKLNLLRSYLPRYKTIIFMPLFSQITILLKISLLS